jgi:hypothetical protein
MSPVRRTTLARLHRRSLTAIAVAASLAAVGLGGGAALALTGSAAAPPPPPPPTTMPSTPQPPPTTGTTSGGEGPMVPDRGGPSAQPGGAPPEGGGSETPSPSSVEDMPTPKDVFDADLNSATSTKQGVDEDGTPYTTYFFEFDDGTMVMAVDDGNDGSVDAAGCDVTGDGDPEYMANEADSAWMPV